MSINYPNLVDVSTEQVSMPLVHANKFCLWRHQLPCFLHLEATWYRDSNNYINKSHNTPPPPPVYG